MLLTLMEDKDYRAEADQAIQSIQAKQDLKATDYEDAGADEVRYARAMWDEDYESGLHKAHDIADRVKGAELAGYRAWWWCLASVAAGLMKDLKSEKDALQRGASCGVNSGWMHQLLQKRTHEPIPEQVSQNPPNAESLWEVLTKWGWLGPGLKKTSKKCRNV